MVLLSWAGDRRERMLIYLLYGLANSPREHVIRVVWDKASSNDNVYHRPAQDMWLKLDLLAAILRWSILPKLAPPLWAFVEDWDVYGVWGLNWAIHFFCSCLPCCAMLVMQRFIP